MKNIDSGFKKYAIPAPVEAQTELPNLVAAKVRKTSFMHTCGTPLSCMHPATQGTTELRNVGAARTHDPMHTERPVLKSVER